MAARDGLGTANPQGGATYKDVHLFLPGELKKPGKATVLGKLNGEHHGVADHMDVSAILDSPDDRSDSNEAWPVHQEARLPVSIAMRAGA